MAKEFKLYIHVKTQSGNFTLINAKKLSSMNNLLNIQGMVESMRSQIEEVKAGAKYRPFLQTISDEQMDAILKEISSKVKIGRHNRALSIYSNDNVNLINLTSNV